MSVILKSALIVALVVSVSLAAALSYAPAKLAPLSAVISAVKNIDLSGLPALEHVVARDGAVLAYRRYNPGGAPFVLLIHGSTGSGVAVHSLAASLAMLGADVVSPDIRGHGASGPLGDIGPDVSLVDDVADLMDRVSLPGRAPRILVGHSSGGGFALQVNASQTGALFRRAILLAPYLGWDQPTTGAGNDAWARANVPRLMALTMLRGVGRRWLGDLPVISFARAAGTSEASATYSFRLFDQFRTRHAQADFENARNPVDIIAGAADELMIPSAYAGMAAHQRNEGAVILLPGVRHMQIVTDPVVTSQAADLILRQAALTSP